jgi:hypothetical protein
MSKASSGDFFYMYLRRIVIENVRGFRSVDFDLVRSSGRFSGWTVITGDNASGKTALLKAIALAVVGPDAARILQPSLAGWIHDGAEVGTSALQIDAGPQDRFAQGRRYDKPFWSELEFWENSANRVGLRPGHKYIRGKTGPTRGPWLEAPDGWFCVGYGPFRRLYGHSPEAQRIMSTPGKVSRFATMFREDATLTEGDLWLRDLRYRELEGNEQAKLTLPKVLAILNHNFLQHGIRVERVDSEGLWLRQPDGVILPLADMSDGYRAALAMLVDIIRQIIDVYGLQGFTSSDIGEPRIESRGVVLVDEIDAHLHPSWQRVIGDWFKHVLPNIQFIVTSHSPLICQAADEDGIFHLPPPGEMRLPSKLSHMDYQHIIASRPNEIYLSPAFGLTHTRSPRAVQARQKYSQLQAKKSAKGLSPEEEKQVEQLSLFVTDDEEDA